MMIPLEQIKAFSECPRYYHFVRDNEPAPVPFRHSVIENIIKEAHLQAIETGYRMDWKRVLTLVDAQVFEEVDVSDPEKFEHAKKLAGYILDSISKWYYGLYLKSSVETYIDIPLKTVVNKQTVHGVIPSIQLGGEIPVITVVSDLGTNTVKLYNDLLVRGMAWLVQCELGCEAVKVIGLGIGQHGALDIVPVHIAKEDHLRTEVIIHQVVSLIVSGIDYPAVTEKCTSCPYTGRCKL
jgi:hypothetical protein